MATIIDYTKKRKSKNIEICPKCGRKGEKRDYFFEATFNHIVEQGRLFSEVKESCWVVNEETSQFLKEVAAYFPEAIINRSNIRSNYYRYVTSGFKKGKTPFQVAAEIGARLLAAREEKLKKIQGEIDCLKKTFQFGV